MAAEYIAPEDKAVIKINENDIPGELIILPVVDQIAFLTLNMSLVVSDKASESIELAMKGDRLIGIVGAKKQADKMPIPGQMYDIGTVARILYVTRAPDS
jgi:ATP-dependent Lon protease